MFGKGETCMDVSDGGYEELILVLTEKTSFPTTISSVGLAP